jgi:tRNA(Ile)-lysidine synthase
MKDLLNKNDKIIAGISGGPDSMYLLDLLLKFKKNTPIEIIVAHVNHNLRGKESIADAKFVKNIAKKHGLKFEIKTLKPIKTGNLEEKCREERYNFFEKLRRKYNAKWILTAHHLDDNIETVLFNFIRGSALSGLKGIEYCSEKRHLLRPLLKTRKKEILSYLKKYNIPFRTDATNEDTRFSRNLIRHKIIPELKKINPNFEKTLAENLVNFHELDSYMQTRTNNWLSKNKKKDRLPLNKFLSLDATLQKNILAHIYKELYGNTNKFNQNHLKQILKIIQQKSSNKKKEFGDKHFIGITRDEKNSHIIEITKTT